MEEADSQPPLPLFMTVAAGTSRGFERSFPVSAGLNLRGLPLDAEDEDGDVVLGRLIGRERTLDQRVGDSLRAP